MKEVHQEVLHYITLRTKQSEIVQLLIDHGADINSASKGGFTSLLVAVSIGSVAMVRLFLETGADMRGDVEDHTPLIFAATYGHAEIMMPLLDVGAEINAHSKSGWTPLTTAARYGHLDCVRYLLDRGADINYFTTDELTPLYAAAGGGYTDIVLYLISKEADTSLSNNRGTSALHVASQEGHLEVIESSFSDEGLLKSRTQGTGTNHSFSKGTGLYMEERDDDGRTAVHHAAISSSVPVIDYLHRIGYGLATFDKWGRTILEYVCISGSLEMIVWVLDHDTWSEPNRSPRKPLSKWSTLHWACRHGNLAILEALNKAGYTFSIITTETPAASWSPFDIGRYFNNAKIVGTPPESWGYFLRCEIVVNDSNGEEVSATVSANNLPAQEKIESAYCDGCFLMIKNRPPF